MIFNSVIQFLESRSIMPKEMPGIEKLKKAFQKTTWFSSIDSKKVIVVAGTNGKGSTCAILESLLFSAGKKVGFYSSPHLIDTTERIRINKVPISQEHFIQLFLNNERLIVDFELTHFESLTLMCADYFFSNTWSNKIDYAIFEVGLGGIFDATNAIPHDFSVITKLALDHTQILGPDLASIAKNKFGIVQRNNRVIHHILPDEVLELKKIIMQQTESDWIQAVPYTYQLTSEQNSILKTKWGEASLNLLGDRAAENAATALTIFSELGFKPEMHLSALQQIVWNGRMQKVDWPGIKAPLFLSGDHNLQGIQSLAEILTHFSFDNLFMIVGIGKDKDVLKMVTELLKIPKSLLYLTETSFKGFKVNEYPPEVLKLSHSWNADFKVLMQEISVYAKARDLVLVTGSLYLVGSVLQEIKNQLVSEIGPNKQAT